MWEACAVLSACGGGRRRTSPRRIACSSASRFQCSCLPGSFWSGGGLESVLTLAGATSPPSARGCRCVPVQVRGYVEYIGSENGRRCRIGQHGARIGCRAQLGQVRRALNARSPGTHWRRAGISRLRSTFGSPFAPSQRPGTSPSLRRAARSRVRSCCDASRRQLAGVQAMAGTRSGYRRGGSACRLRTRARPQGGRPDERDWRACFPAYGARGRERAHEESQPCRARSSSSYARIDPPPSIMAG